MKHPHQELYLSSTCQVRMSLCKLKPVHLATSFLKRNLGSSCRLSCNSLFLNFLNRVPSASWCYRSRQFTWQFWRELISNIERQKINFTLPLRGSIFRNFIPQKTATLTLLPFENSSFMVMPPTSDTSFFVSCHSPVIKFWKSPKTKHSLIF